jgi:hypothetical protein
VATLSGRWDGETGLIGKLLALWLVVAALLLLLVLDVGSILLARYRTADLAQDVAFTAAESFAATGDVDEAREAAREEIRRSGADARLKRIDVNGREVTVVVVGRAGTLLLDLLPFTEDLARVTVTDTAAPSGG